MMAERTLAKPDPANTTPQLALLTPMSIRSNGSSRAVTGFSLMSLRISRHDSSLLRCKCLSSCREGTSAVLTSTRHGTPGARLGELRHSLRNMSTERWAVRPPSSGFLNLFRRGCLNSQPARQLNREVPRCIGWSRSFDRRQARRPDRVPRSRKSSNACNAFDWVTSCAPRTRRSRSSMTTGTRGSAA